MTEERTSDRHIEIGHDVSNSVVVSGDGNQVTHTQTHITQVLAAGVKTQRFIVALTITVIGVVAGFGTFFWVKDVQEQSKREILSLTADQMVKPGLLHITRQLLTEAEELAKRGDVNEALRYYRQVVTYTLSLRQQEKNIRIPGEEHVAPNCLSRSEDQTDQVFCQAEAALAKLIQNSRLSKLREQLGAKPPSIGQRKNFLSSGENQSDVLFTPGALKTTFDILRLKFGAGADVDYSGQIYTLKEADRMPCKTLEDIEKLWRQYTNHHCGWYSESDKRTYTDPDCKELGGETLTAKVFNYPSDSAIRRINQCRFLPVQLKLSDES